MTQKIVLIADPGIDTAFAIALALRDPDLEVLGLIASAGNVSAEAATQNVHLLINEIDCERWPRVGAALPVVYGIDGTSLHGPDGLGGVSVPSAPLHQPTPGDRLLVELAHAYPGEITVVILGPATMLARSFDRDPELSSLLKGVVMMGGTWRERGNASPTAEFHFFCDPESTRRVLRCGLPIRLFPLDVTRKLVFSPTDLLELPSPESPTCQFLRKIVPFGIRASSNLYGIEGFHLKDVLGIAALVLPGAVRFESVHVDVEPRGELTRGMMVVDNRPAPAATPNAKLATHVEATEVRHYIRRILHDD